MGFFGRQKEKNENEFGKNFPRWRNVKLLWFAEENQHLGEKKVLYKGTDTSYCYKVTLSSRSNLTHTNSNLIYLVPKHFKKLFLLSLCDTTWVKLWVEICIAIKTIESVLFQLKNSFRPEKWFDEIKFSSF